MRRKIITDPLLNEIDITDIWPIVETLEFQRMRQRKQMGISYFVFTTANHLRFEHCLGAYPRTVFRTQKLLEEGIISKQQAKNLQIFSAIHDIGHGPFSHVIEPICSIDHEKNGLQIIQRIRPEIEKCDGDFDKIALFFQKSDPLHLIVMDKNLGSEKFDYLERDAWYTATGSRAAEMTRLNRHTTFVNDRLAIDMQVVDEAEEMQNFYMLMYKKVYLSRSAVIIQDLLRKVLIHLLDSGEVKEEDLWQMTDEKAIAFLEFSKDPLIRYLWPNFERRCFPKVAISFRLVDFGTEERLADEKNTKIFEISREEMAVLAKIQARAMRQLEKNLAEMLGLPYSDILIVGITSPERFVPEDIQIVIDKNRFTSLFKVRKRWAPSLRERADSYMAFRVCSFEQHRDILISRAKEIKTCIFQFASNLPG